jgi:hypothetical protein
MPTLRFKGFDNHPRQPQNTCGQAVIASVLHYRQKYPGAVPPTSEALLDDVLLRYGPNWPIRNCMTHPSIILRALSEAGVTHTGHSRRSLGVLDALTVLEQSIDRGAPVIVLLHLYPLKMAKPFILHWCVVIGYDADHIILSSWGKEYSIARSAMRHAMKPMFLPRSLREYMIVIE